MKAKQPQRIGDTGQDNTLRETLAEQFTAFDRSSNALTHLAQQFTLSTFSGKTREHLSQQFTQSIFQTQQFH